MPNYPGDTAYTQDSASGTTTNSWADALDLDTRGVKSLTVEIENTHGSNSMDCRVKVRVADYASGTDEDAPEPSMQVAPTLAHGEKALAQTIMGYSRVKVQVKSTVTDTPATYSIKYLINR